MTTIGIRVREMRHARGWSEGQLASAAGMTPAEIADVESGRWRYIDHVTLAKLARALECGIGVLLRRHSGPSSDP